MFGKTSATMSLDFFGFGLRKLLYFVQKSGRKCIHGATNKIDRIDETYSMMKRYKYVL